MFTLQTSRLWWKFYELKKAVRCTQVINRHFWENMECVDLQPPSEVRGMVVLDRDLFRKRVRIPILKINGSLLNKVKPFLKASLLKMEKLKPVRNTTPCPGGDGCESFKEILLHPRVITGWGCVPKEISALGVNETSFYFADLELTYENWRADEILRSVLPADQEGMSSFSRIGHIVHINLRDHLEPYKKFVGEVLLDKTVGCRAVVNKTKNIDNTYRNFDLELICGEPDYLVEVKENGVTFQFDFSSVYWNPRLSTEHDRIVNLLAPGDILYDVFAGVGPFSVAAAAKKKCIVLANDLNPVSYKWLNINLDKNKCKSRVRTFNKDGREFLRNDVLKDMLDRWRSSGPENRKMHIVMNLPALAVEFLDVFHGLCKDMDPGDFENIVLPQVHVYTFVKAASEKETLAKDAVETNLGATLTDNLIGVHFVRNVAPNKDMFRVSFVLTVETLFDKTSKRKLSTSLQDPINKKSCF